MAAQVLFFNVFSEKDPHLNAVEDYRKREQELMIKQLRNDPKIIPKPSRDEMIKILFFFYSLFYVDTDFLFINLQIVL